ncbi:MAG: DivIVA domain-containing protein [Bacteroidetes bacterium]|nr:DivIVA domain-containing protein [Bacteroidota bacterium]MCZ6898761.1 DivIVA domain-containing protein [Bacteroidota bacterium]
MKITPLEIRQKTFERGFRGYDKDEVQAFLKSLSKEWERVQDEIKELKMKLEASEKEVHKLREVESSLFKTLKTAEDTGANMIQQANKSAELHLKESQMKADAVMNETKSKARAMIERAEMETRDVIEGMHDEVKLLEQSFRTIENYRDNLMVELKNLSSDLSEKIEKLNAQKKYYKIEEIKQQGKQVARMTEDFIQPLKKKITTVNKPESKTDSGDEPNQEDKSFFDQIG